MQLINAALPTQVQGRVYLSRNEILASPFFTKVKGATENKFTLATINFQQVTKLSALKAAKVVAQAMAMQVIQAKAKMTLCFLFLKMNTLIYSLKT